MSDRASQPPASGGPRRRSPWRLPLIIVGALAALAAAAWVALVIAFPPARVRALVQAQMARSLKREARFDDASISPWPPVRITVRGPALAEPGGFAAGSAFKAKSVLLDLNLLGFMTRRLVVDRLEIVEPVVHVVVHPDGTTNFDGLAPPAAAAPPGQAPTAPALDLLVREFRVRDGRLQLDDQRAHRRVVLGLDTRLGFSLEHGGQRIGTSGTWAISGLAFGPETATRLSDLNRSLAALTWKVEHRGGLDLAAHRLTLDRLALGFGRSELALSGTVSDLGPRAVLDLRARGEKLDLGELLGFLAAADAPAVKGVTGSGSARFDLAIAGGIAPGQRPEVTGTIAVGNAALRYPGALVPVEGLSFNARLSPDAVEVPDLSARIAGQPLTGSLDARHFADPTVSFAVKGDIDLAAVGPLVAPKDTRVAGRAALDVRGSGRAKDPGSLALEGRASLHDVSAQSPALPKKVEGVNGSIAFSPARADLQSLTARAGQSSFTMSGSATRPLAMLAKAGTVAPAEVQFRFDSPYLDLGELLPPGPSKPAQFNARGGGEVAIGRLKNQKLDVRNVKAKVTLSPNQLDVPSFSLDGYGGAVAGRASFGLQDLAKPTFAIKAHADSVRANEFLSAFTPAAGVLNGSVNADFDLAGAGSQPKDVLQSLTAVGLAAMKQGHLSGPALDGIAKLTGREELRDLRFNDLHLPFRVERGRVVTDPVKLTGPYGDWKATGAIGFDGALDYAVSMALPRDVVARLGTAGALAANTLADRQGNVPLDLLIGGNARAPRVALDAKAMAARLTGNAGAAAQEQRDKLAREALEGALGKKFAPDSTGKQPSLDSPQVREAVQKKANELLEGLFGKKKAPAAPSESTARGAAPD
ncbi:MAG TPA: AsmA-like C-terminal region-containing protein, partial [Candidatus Eisenbacteria bacterium]